MLKGSTLFVIALVFVVALALVIHLYGPHLGQLLHGGR